MYGGLRFFCVGWRKLQIQARQALEGRAKARSGGSAQRDQRNGAEGRNPGSATHRARDVLLRNVCITKKAPQKEKEEKDLDLF
jgi:hypothetical protein